MQVRTPEPAMDLRAQPLAALPGALLPRVGAHRPSTNPAARLASAISSRTCWRCCHAAPPSPASRSSTPRSHQFEAGDVLHWWHPPSGRGRAHALLGRPAVAAVRGRSYVEATGDCGHARRARALPQRAAAATEARTSATVSTRPGRSAHAATSTAAAPSKKARRPARTACR